MFTHLHTHSYYSLLDGAMSPERMAKRAKSLGQNAIALTDHGNMYGLVSFYKACKKEGVKPIIGCEFYSAPNGRTEKNINDKYDHIVILAKNEQGYKNMCQLSTQSFIDGFYVKPRIDDELLERYSEGLICLSGCISGRIPKLLLAGQYDAAKEKAMKYKAIFGEDFYIEVQNHGIADELRCLPLLYKLAAECGIKTVCTNDAHYAEESDAEAQDVLLCIQTASKVADAQRMKFEGTSFYLKSEDEMRSLFSEHPESIENTNEIVSKCNFEYDFGKVKLPRFEIPAGYADNTAYFTYLCEKGLKERYGENPPQEYIDRMKYEIGVISKMGYVDYFLIVLDFINWAKDRDIPVGPGRGSGAGSICAYCTKITNIDPMRYNLFFERFLNPERVSMPDFDIDFCYNRREEVIKYVTEKYGATRVSQIITYMTMAAKAAIKDVARVLDVPYAKANEIAKLVPNEVHMTIAKALDASTELKAMYDNDATVKKVIDIAMKIEGTPKSTSKHAAGVLISDADIVNYVPLCIDGDGNVVVQSTMLELEDFGLLKFDFLGLRTLTVINDTVKAIEKNYGVKVDIDTIDDTDQSVFEMLTAGKTNGVFQLESEGMKSTLAGLAPTSIEDLTALVSLYRPGPMDSIPTYINNKNNPDSIIYDDARLKDILGVTYGCLVYQEQVMKLFQVLGGFTLGRSDIVRRAISKKKAEVLEQEKKNFIYGVKDENGNVIAAGALANGVPEATCVKIMDEVTAFASYAFNKSHAACYAVIAYQTAWLKKHYPKEFFAALLTSVIDNADKLKSYISAITKEEGIKILPPSVNTSTNDFVSDKENIVFGLAGLKNIGGKLMEEMIRRRDKDGPFTSFYDFVDRMNGTAINKKAFEALIKAGAFDWTGHTRRTLIENTATIVDAVNSKVSSAGQLSLFDYIEDGKKYEEPTMQEYKEYPKDVMLHNEHEVMGMYVSGHPIQKCSNAIARINAMTPTTLAARGKDEWVTICGVIFDAKKKLTKKGTKMCAFTLQDETTSIDGVAFEKCLNTSEFLFENGTCVCIKGKAESREGKMQIIVNTVYAMPSNDQPEDMMTNFVKTVGVAKTPKEAAPVKVKTSETEHVGKAAAVAPKADAPKRGMYIRMKDASEINKYCEVLATIPGSTQVFLFDAAERKMYMNPNIKVCIQRGEVIQQIAEMAGPGGLKFIKD